MLNIYLQAVTIDSVISDLLDSIRQGIEWGNAVVIGVTASLLAISLIRFLYSRN